MAERQYELILLGATGYTGKLTAEWISEHLPTDLKWAIAGRNATKLDGVVEELKRLNPDRKQPDVETCSLEEAPLTALAQKTKLLISTVGPFLLYGEPVLAACARSGTHYLDCTGEVPWIHSMIPKYHQLAQSTGAILIPECGLDSVPADMLTYALTRHVRKTLHSGTASVDMSLLAVKGGFSGGTSETILLLFEHYGARKLGQTMDPWSIAPIRPKHILSSPKGSLFYRMLGLANIPELGGLQARWLMAGVDKCITNRSWGLYESSARSSSNPELSYGSHFDFNETKRVKSALTGALVNLAYTVFGLVFAFPLTRWVLAPLVRRFVITPPGQGPTRESMKGDFMKYKAIAIADSEQKQKVAGRLNLPHSGYVATAQTLSAAAFVILRGRLADTQAAKLGGGILTPATLGEPFLDQLSEFGFKIEVGV